MGGRAITTRPPRGPSYGGGAPARGHAGPMAAAFTAQRPVLLPPPYPGADPLNGYNILPWPIASFQTSGLAGYWQGVGATLTQTTAQVYDASQTLALTTTVSGDCTASTTSTRYPVQPGQVYYAQLQAAVANLIPNPSFESGTAGWMPQHVNTIAQQPGGSVGRFSLLATSTNAGQDTGAITAAHVPVVAGTTYTLAADVNPAQAGTTPGLGVNWFTAGNVYITTTYVQFGVQTPGAWTTLTSSHVAPATATQADPFVTETSVPVGYAIGIDNVWFAPASGPVAAIEVDFYDQLGNQVAATVGPYQPVSAAAGMWTRITGPVGGWVAPAGAVSARPVAHINAGAAGIQVLLDAVYVGLAPSPPVFTSNTYISFDPPSAANPAWVDITPFVAIDGAQISITRGRQDGLNDVNASTLAATLDDADGRFIEGNPGGPWYGLLHKGNWIRQAVTFDGQQSTRFVGFITSLPAAGLGGAQTSAITASDWFSKLGQYAVLNSTYYEEVTNDPAGAVCFAFYPLNESAPTKGVTGAPSAVTTNDISGFTGTNLATALAPHNVAGGGGTVAWAQATAPGYDSDQAITFQPAGSNQGIALRGQLSQPTGLNWCLEFWMQMPGASFSNGEVTLLTLADYSAAQAVQLVLSVSKQADDGQDGFLKFSILPTTVSSPFAGSHQWESMLPLPGVTNSVYLPDGAWHHIAVVYQPTSTSGGNLFAFIDGTFIPATSYGFGPLLNTLQTITVGGRDDILNNPGQVAGDPPGPANTFAGSIYGLSITNTTACPTKTLDGNAGVHVPSIAAHYQACATGFGGESVSQRLTRIARYAGVPAAWCNFDTSVSLAGPQQLLGRYPLDVMREAARTEAMPLYCATDGRITLRNRTVRMNGTAAWTIQAAELDQGTQQTNDYAYLINEVDVSRALASTIKVIGAAGAASQARYGLYYTTQNTANVSDQDALTFGQWVIAGTSNPLPRLAPVGFEAASLAQTSNPTWANAGYGSAFYTAVLASDISTFCAVAALPAVMGGGTQLMVIEGSTETIDHAVHTLAFNTTPATGVPVFTSVFQLDVSPFNQLDSTNVLAY